MNDDKYEPVRERAERYEIIDGQVYDMSASPNTRHQRIVGTIYAALLTGLKGSGCGVFLAPLDVWPTGEESEVVQPDVFVVCDKRKITDAGCVGAPDLIIEVLSPSTAKKDRLAKLALYQRCQVPEFWLVDGSNETIEVFRFQPSGYSLPDVYTATDDEAIPVGIFEDVQLQLKEIFEPL